MAFDVGRHDVALAEQTEPADDCVESTIMGMAERSEDITCFAANPASCYITRCLQPQSSLSAPRKRKEMVKTELVAQIEITE
jgi:hypothetical protein